MKAAERSFGARAEGMELPWRSTEQESKKSPRTAIANLEAMLNPILSIEAIVYTLEGNCSKTFTGIGA
jgi:hypothetical protein